MDFNQAFKTLIGHEGGYVDDPEDPGGETNFGISKRSYPQEDIPNMTLERATEIYQRDFWWAAGCDAVGGGSRVEGTCRAWGNTPGIWGGGTRSVTEIHSPAGHRCPPPPWRQRGDSPR